MEYMRDWFHSPLGLASPSVYSLPLHRGKKLYALNPARKLPPVPLAVQSIRGRQRVADASPQSVQRAVRQRLADKVSGNLVGIWLLLPEHLRLGTWDLRPRTWTGDTPAQSLNSRLALHLIHEAALCRPSLRYGLVPAA